ncbi:MAG: protein kinase [Gemmatimonadota bacterium]
MSARPGEEAESRLRLQLALGDGFEVRKLLGQGGFGLVFTAFDKRLKRDLAVKVLRIELARASAFLDRFEREAMTAAQLRHPNIVPIYSTGEKDGLAYIVMPLIQGETLQTLLERDGPLPLSETCRILVDAAGALAAAHSVGLIHRDIKPDNIMLEGPERRVLLMDFGIAKMLENTDAALTGTGVLIGTPLYMSPEQASGDRVDQRSDIYSLGIVGYYMLTGKPPFGGTSGAELIRQHVLTPAADVREARPTVPTRLAETVMRCLRKERERRWQTAGELRSALNAAAVQPESGFARTSLFQVSSQLRRHVIPLISLMVLAAVATIWIGIRNRNRTLPLAEPVEVTSVAAPADPVDSLLVASRGAADYSRQRAVTAGAPAAQLVPGDSVRQLADSLAGLGRKAEAAVLLTSAAGLWEKAERGVRGGSGSASTPTAARAPGTQPPASRTSVATTETRPPAVVSDSQAIVSYYQELSRAVEARQLGEVKRLLPNLSSGDERTWRGIFEDRDVDSVKVSYVVESVTRQESMTHARVRYSQTVTKKGRPQDRGRIFNATLTLGPQGWRQIREEKAH